MSSDGSSSATKWLVGCLVAAFLCVVLCAGGAIFAVRTAFVGARNAAQQMATAAREADRRAAEAAQEAQRQMAEQAEQTQFAAAWLPPAAETGPDVLFPEAVSGWRRTSFDDAAEVADLGLARPGRHAVYESGIDGIDVYVYEIGADEQSSVFQAAADGIDAGNYTTRSKISIDDGTVHHLTFSFAPPERHGLMWWCKGWLLLFIADDAQVDLKGFQTEYATLIQGVPASVETTSETQADGAAPAIEETGPEASPDRPAAEQDGSPTPDR